MIWRIKVIFLSLFYVFMAILNFLKLFFLSEVIYKIAIKIWPSRRTEWIANLGFIYEMSGKLEEAEKSYRQAIKLEPENAFHYFEIANIYEKQNKLILAIENYEESLQLEKDFGEPLKREIQYKIDDLKNSTKELNI